MKAEPFQDKGFVDYLYSPLTLAPIGLGLTTIIVGFVVPAAHQKLCFFIGGMLCLIGVGLLITLWLMGGEDPKRVQMRTEFLDALEAVCAGERMQSQAAEKRGTPAKIES